MTWTGAFHLVEAVGSFATAVGVGFVWWQIRLVKQQARTTFEDGLTREYRRIMKSIPIEVWLGLDLPTDKERQDRCRDAIYRYIDLSNEQAFLHDKKRVTPETWRDWSEGIKTNLGLPAFKKIWEQVKKECPKSFSELRKVVDPCL
ncbi:MAG TPA: hypothetical protein VGY31_14970 [Terriglobia bacterium]|nr:hypothetical protein [Terriglobia bacterium]